jgi:hypothetical protein
MRDRPWSDLEADNTHRLLRHINVESQVADTPHFDQISSVLMRSKLLRHFCFMHGHCDVKMVEHMDWSQDWSQFFAQCVYNWLVFSDLDLRDVSKRDILIVVVLLAVPSGTRQVIQVHPVAIVLLDQLGKLFDFIDRPLTLTHYIACLVAVLMRLFVGL